MTKTLTPTENTKKNKVTTQKRHQKLRVHDDCGPPQDGQLQS